MGQVERYLDGMIDRKNKIAWTYMQIHNKTYRQADKEADRQAHIQQRGV